MWPGTTIATIWARPPRPDEPGEPLGLGSNLGTLQSVYFVSSDDGGETWSDNVRVNDVPIDRSIGTWNGQFFVVVPVSVTSWDDRALVSWSDTRNGTSATGTQDIYTGAITAGDDGDDSMVAVLAAALVGAGLTLLVVAAVLRSRKRSSAGATAT